MKKVAGYGRVSTLAQTAEDKTSPKYQKDRIAEEIYNFYLF